MPVRRSVETYRDGQVINEELIKGAFTDDLIPYLYDGDCFTNAEWEMADIKLKVEAYQANYIRTLPIHNSQKETETTDEYSIFTYRLVPTFEFERELISKGRNFPDSYKKRDAPTMM